MRLRLTEVQLQNMQNEYDLACQDGRVQCSTDSASSGDTTDDSVKSSLDFKVIGIVAAVIIVALLGGLFVMRGERVEENLDGFKWADTTLPASDAVANSMYGGAQEIFQQPVAAATPTTVNHTVVNNVTDNVVQNEVVTSGASTVAGPPLPATGLPAGWTMEQWAYYGHQYQQ